MIARRQTAGTPAYGRAPRRVNIARLLCGLVTLAAALWFSAPPAGADNPVHLLVLGDSLTAGYGLPREEGFVPVLERALREAGHDVEVINAGVSGDTTAGGLARLDWALGEPVEAAIVELGANDALRALPPEEARKNLDAILTRLKREEIPVLLAGMRAPPNLGREYAQAFEAIFPDLAEKHDVLLYPFFLEGVAADPSLNQPDGIHPNARGVEVVVENILPRVRDLLGQVR